MSEDSRRWTVVQGRFLVIVVDSCEKDRDSCVSTCVCDTAELLACREALPTEVVGFRPRQNLLTLAPSRISP
jgi:hypothetical protein